MEWYDLDKLKIHTYIHKWSYYVGLISSNHTVMTLSFSQIMCHVCVCTAKLCIVYSTTVAMAIVDSFDLIMPNNY